MSLHLILGNSGGGKTHTLYETVIREARAFPDRTFLVIVPEQFTLETQRELVEMHPGHSLMNIDILSFQRLGHRLLEEAGLDDREVLDDTGKNFILRRIADRRRGDLKVLGARLDRMGMIDEIKSFLSELMQYNLMPEDVDRMIDEAPHTSLKWKLEDIRLLYTDFLDEIEGKAITAEGLLTQMGRLAADSQLLADSVIALDGYTGFTPVQVDLLSALMQAARDLYVTVTIDTDEGCHLMSMTRTGSKSDLFYLSRRTIRQLTDLAAETGTEIADPVYCTDGAKYRFRRAPQLYYLEQHLFRRHAGSDAVYALQPGEGRQVSIRACTEPRDELTYCLREIRRQVTAGEAGYGDFAIMTGKLDRYENFAPELFAAYEVPFFLDRTRRLDAHPFPQAIGALLRILSDDFFYRDVFGFLRSGFGPLDETETDRLENYVLATGVRGYSAWRKTWRRNPQKPDAEALSDINALRQRFMEEITPLRETFQRGGGRVETNSAGRSDADSAGLIGTDSADRPVAGSIREKTIALYYFLEAQGAQEKLAERAETFRTQGNPVRAREEEQIWTLVMQLLEKLTDVLGDAKASASDYRALLEAGFTAVTLRVAPPRKDTVVFGDMERTRLNHVKTLFLIGANDGVIPGAGSEGGILSEFERQSLKDAGEEMAYSAREQVLLQNFYLYQNLTKPECSLQITYAQRGSDGTALRRSSLIAAIEKLYALPAENEAAQPAETAAAAVNTAVSADPAEAVNSAVAANPAEAVNHAAQTDSEAAGELLTAESALDFFAREAGVMAELADRRRDADDIRQLAENAAVSSAETVGGSDDADRRLEELWRALGSYYIKTDRWQDQVGHIMEASCSTQADSRLQPQTANSLYGEVLRGSVSRLEQYASCPFSHFAKYGLKLDERQIASFEAADMGTLLHDAVRNFTVCVQEAAGDPGALSDADRAAFFVQTDEPLRPFHDLTETGIDHYAEVAINMALAERAADSRSDTGGTDEAAGKTAREEATDRELFEAAFDTASDRQIARRLQRVFYRTAYIITEQVKAGAFEPVQTEVPFRMELALDGGRRMKLSGRIDRVDTAQIPREEDASVPDSVTAVRIVDYKSSETDFRIKDLYEGKSIQLPLYLAAVTEDVRTEPVPAGMYYYAMIDPVLDEKAGESPEEQDARLKKELRLSGVTSRQDDVIEAMEPLPPGGESCAVRLKLNQSKPNKPDNPAALVSKSSQTQDPADFALLPVFAQKKAAQMGDAIAGGDIRVLPRRESSDRTSCTYCPYRSVCGFDMKNPQYRYRESDIKGENPEDEAMRRIREETGMHTG